MSFINFVLLPFVARFFLVVMFPFSAYDKIAHWDEAMAQEHTTWIPGAPAMLVAAIIAEFSMPFCILCGWHDRLAAFILAGFCVITAVLFHPFWRFPDFWPKEGVGRAHFWDFLKNFGLAGGLLLVVVAGGAVPLKYLASHPLSATPYTAKP